MRGPSNKQIGISAVIQPADCMTPWNNLVPRVLSYPPYGAWERETLENAGHVAPEQIISNVSIFHPLIFVMMRPQKKSTW